MEVKGNLLYLKRGEAGSGEFPKQVHRTKIGGGQGSFLIKGTTHTKAEI